ncbi:uncharacterized protein JCM15063_000064, partial [Sporobolomyces koalae]|uniref:uncharacterized protein n=1 Tax=Sporobolomyces koalae TaxID=500713 RepID=UPI00317CFEDB
GKVTIDAGQLYAPLGVLRKKLESFLRNGTLTVPEIRQRFTWNRLRMINSLLERRTSALDPRARVIIVFDHPDVRPEAKTETLERRMRSQVKTDIDLETWQEEKRLTVENKKQRRARRVNRKRKGEGKGEVESEGKGKTPEVGALDAPVDQTITKVDLDTAFPPFLPLDSENIRELRESEDTLDHQIAAQAEALHARADQILAKTEADYVIPLIFSTSADAPARLAAHTERSLDRSAPSTLSVPGDDVPESSERDIHARPARVIYSEDSDMIIAAGDSIVDFIVAPCCIKKTRMLRVIDVRSMVPAMNWQDRWHAAGLAAFVGNDFTDGGIAGIGWSRLCNAKELDRVARASETWCRVRRDLETGGTTQDLIDGQNFTSLDALDSHFDSIISPRHHDPSGTRPKLTLRAWSDSVSIQAGWNSTGSMTSKRDVRVKVQQALREQMEKEEAAFASRRSDAMQIDDSTSPPSRRPRDRGHRVLFRRRQQALTFDARITNVVDCPRPIKGQLGFRMKSQANGPEYFRFLRDEAARLKAPAAAQDDNNGPPRKRRRTQAPTNATLNAVEPQPSPCQQEAPKDGKTQPESKDRGKEGQNDETGQNEGGEPEETKTKPQVKRFPNLLKAKQCIVRRPASERVLRNLFVDGDATFRKSFANLLHWIRQIEVAEMPMKVGLLNQVINLYARFAPHHLVPVLDGGDQMTKWAAAILTQREWYDMNRMDHDSNSSEAADAAADHTGIPNTMADAVTQDLKDDLELYVKKQDLGASEITYCENTTGAKTLDFYCRLAIVLDARSHEKPTATEDNNKSSKSPVTDDSDQSHGPAVTEDKYKHVDGASLNDSVFNARNLSPFGTAIANSTRSDAKRFDWILAKLIVEFPEHFRVNSRSLPFGTDNAEILAALDAISSDEGVVLANLSNCVPVKRLVREAIATIPIAGDADPARLSLAIVKLVHDCRLLLLDWQLPPLVVIDRTTFATAVDKIGTYIGSAFRWVEAELRAWVKERDCGETAPTLGDWICAATGQQDSQSQKLKRQQPAWAQDRKGKEALKNLMVVVAGHAQLRQRSYRFSPSTIWISLESVCAMVVGDFDLVERIMSAMRRIDVEVAKLNGQLATHNLDVSKLPAPDAAAAKDRFGPERIAQATLQRMSKRDSTMRRQLDNRDKIVLPELHEWRGLEFEKADHEGPLLVLKPTVAVRNRVQATVGKVHQIFKLICTKILDARTGCVFLMDVLFKPTHGQLLLNGDIGVSATEWHLGAIDHRKRDRSFVKDADRTKLARARLLEEMNSDKSLIEILEKLKKVSLTQKITRGHKLSTEEIEIYNTRKEQKRTKGRDALSGRQPKRREEMKNEPVLTRFQLSIDGKIEFRQSSPHIPPTSSSTTTGMARQRPLDKPVEIYERSPPHLYISGVPANTEGWERPKRAFDFASTFFAEAETAGVQSTAASSSSVVNRQHVLVAHDPGQVEAVATSILNLTGTGSSRAFVRQRQFQSQESQESRVYDELTRFSVGTRLGDALQASRSLAPNSSDESSDASTSSPALVNHSASLPALSSSDQPLATPAAPVLASPKSWIVRLNPSNQILAVESPILHHVLHSIGSHLSTLRAKESEAIAKKRDQSRASAVVRTSVKKPTGWSPLRNHVRRVKVLHVLPSGNVKVNKGFGKDRSKVLIAAYEQALRTTPWLDVSTVSCGEWWTSSVCQDPRCRATWVALVFSDLGGSLLTLDVVLPCRIFRPGNRTSLRNTPINRLKFCIFCLTIDHRDGLAGLNVSSLAYFATQELGENPFSLKSAVRRKAPRRVSGCRCKTIEKMITDVLRGKTEEQVKDLMAELGKQNSISDAVQLLRQRLRGYDPDLEDEVVWDSDSERDGQSDEESVDDDVDPDSLL